MSTVDFPIVNPWLCLQVILLGNKLSFWERTGEEMFSVYNKGGEYNEGSN